MTRLQPGTASQLAAKHHEAETYLATNRARKRCFAALLLPLLAWQVGGCRNPSPAEASSALVAHIMSKPGMGKRANDFLNQLSSAAAAEVTTLMRQHTEELTYIAHEPELEKRLHQIMRSKR